MESEERKIDIAEIVTRNRFLSKVYLWMTLALSISGGVALLTANSPKMLATLFANGGMGFIILCILEIVVVSFLSLRIRKISAFAATVGFVIYSVINGLTLSSIFLAYQFSSIVLVFFISAAMFLVMAIYGSITKSKLTSFGRYFSMALIGTVIAIVVNIFLKSSMLDILISIVSVVIFTGLTAYDAQKLAKASRNAENQEADVFTKAAVIGALELYLDFINIFLSLLRLFGRRK